MILKGYELLKQIADGNIKKNQKNEVGFWQQAQEVKINGNK